MSLPVLELQTAYGIDTNTGQLTQRHGPKLMSHDACEARQLTGEFQCFNLHRTDVVLAAKALSTSGVTDVDYVVLNYSADKSVVANVDFINANPDFITYELASKLSALCPPARAQLGLNRRIGEYIHANFKPWRQ